MVSIKNIIPNIKRYIRTRKFRKDMDLLTKEGWSELTNSKDYNDVSTYEHLPNATQLVLNNQDLINQFSKGTVIDFQGGKYIVGTGFEKANLSKANHKIWGDLFIGYARKYNEDVEGSYVKIKEDPMVIGEKNINIHN